jgi:hypothetical protein
MGKDPDRDPNARHVQSLGKLFSGEDAFVAGTGPSLMGFDWGRLAGLRTVALNDAVLVRGFFPTIHIFADANIWDRYREGVDYSRTILVCKNCVRKDLIEWEPFAHRDRVWQFDQTSSPEDMREDDDLLYVSNTVATAAICLAWKLGARRIFLLGVDGYKVQRADGRAYYYHDGSGKPTDEAKRTRQVFGDLVVQDRHQKWASQMGELAKFFRKRKLYQERFPGSGVFNLSPKSLVGWEKVDLDAAVPRREEEVRDGEARVPAAVPVVGAGGGDGPGGGPGEGGAA